jgi:hypothetical protein
MLRSLRLHKSYPLGRATQPLEGTSGVAGWQQHRRLPAAPATFARVYPRYWWLRALKGSWAGRAAWAVIIASNIRFRRRAINRLG